MQSEGSNDSSVSEAGDECDKNINVWWGYLNLQIKINVGAFYY